MSMNANTNAYIGNGAYCYSNSTSMLVHTYSERITPEIIEVLSGVGLGALWFSEDQMIFFSNGAPHTGVNKALDILGFSYTVQSHSSGDTLELSAILQQELEHHPIMLGPLDMGYLSYMPNHPYLHGCDHYVLALKQKDDYVCLHDPAGFPYTLLPMDALIKASNSSKLQYHLYPQDLTLHYWHSPIRTKEPSREEIYHNAVQHFKLVYNHAQEQAKTNSWLTGANAIYELINYIRDQGDGIHLGLQGHLTHFAFQVGARRALNYSEFFQRENISLSHIKQLQAELFGKCHALSITGQWQDLANQLQQLAELESQFEDALLQE